MYDSPFNDQSLKVIESMIDKNKDLVFVFHNGEPILFNKASKDFFGVDTLKEFRREFGSLENKFVPHDSYFHASKTGEQETWQESLLALDKSEQIVSMISSHIKAHAFSVSIDIPLEGFEIIYFSDITTSLIKTIMTQNNTNLDSDSGAYSKKYFEHISPRFLSAAEFNEKLISTCLIELESDDNNLVQRVADSIKDNTRDDDMLVRWSSRSFLLASLIGSKEHAYSFGDKILTTIKQNRSQEKIRVAMTLQSEKDHIHTMISRCENRLKDSEESFSIA